MPIVIKDFEVVSNGSGNGAEQSPEPAAAAPTAQRPLSARQAARLMKRVKDRALRLHAD